MCVESSGSQYKRGDITKVADDTKPSPLWQG